MRVCRHCGKEFRARVGLGLCRRCWNDPDVRPHHQPVAPFGGAAAANLRGSDMVEINEWHEYAETYPLLAGEEFEAFCADVRQNGQRETVKYRMHEGRRQGLDGRNRYRACRELNLEPRVEKVFLLDTQVRPYIDSLNLHRRHLTAEHRRRRAALLRAGGLTIRQIADALQVSPGTVHGDLKDIEDPSLYSGVQNRTPEVTSGEEMSSIAPAPGLENTPSADPQENNAEKPPETSQEKDGAGGPRNAFTGAAAQPGEVVGRDGKTYRAKRKPKGDGGKPKAKKSKPPAPREELRDRVGNVLPDGVRDAFADPALPELVEELENLAGLMRPDLWARRAGRLCPHYPFLLIANLDEHAHEALRHLQVALEAVRAALPYAVCPECQGAPPRHSGTVCRTCRNGGHVPEHRYEELKREGAV